LSNAVSRRGPRGFKWRSGLAYDEVKQSDCADYERNSDKRKDLERSLAVFAFRERGATVADAVLSFECISTNLTNHDHRFILPR
jgi:hypothetical protein